ncbi:MAG: FecR domain-containing protein [Syntrophaceae bacterium]|nr:FecR domain-containing protein [Syntrophaceae bacterium]
MKKYLWIAGLLAVCVGLALSDPVRAARATFLKIGPGQAVVSVLEGSATATSPGKKGARSLRAGDLLRGGDEVVTGRRSRLELTLPDRSVVRFADNTRFKILQISTEEASKRRDVRIHMSLGRGWAKVSKTFTGRSRFDLSCENAVAGVRGTVWRMNVDADQSAMVRVYDGEVNVAGGQKTMDEVKSQAGPSMRLTAPKPIAGPRKVTMEEWTYIVRSLQEIRIDKNGTASKPFSFSPEADRDEWVDWNKERDQES